MKKILKLAFVVLLLVAFKNSWALEQATTSDTTSAVPLATVNIQEAKIVSQDGNNFKISFFLTNREGFQTGVKYGVRLYTKDEKKQLDIVVNEKIYDDKFRLSPGARVKKEIDYIAPNVLNGEYNIALSSYNVQGFPLAFFNLGEVNLTRTLKGVEILNDSCSIKVNSKESKIKTNDRILIEPEDNIYLNCTVMNYDNKVTTVTPVFETRLGSSYGEAVSPTGGDDKSITLKALENKEISILIPTKFIEPQVYNLSFYLKGGESNSNQVKIDYKIDGVSATIYNISLDKSNYKSGDIAKVTALLRVNKALVGESNPLKYYLSVNILNDKNARCGKQFTKEIDNSFVSNFDISINNKCSKAQIVASITDGNGKILSQMGNAVIKSPLSLINLAYVIIALVIIIMVVLLIINKKKMNKGAEIKQDVSGTGTVTSIVLLIAASLFANFLFVNKASADTFCLTRLNPCDVLTTVSLNKSNYLPGETITAGGFMTSDIYKTAYLYGWPSSLNHTLKATQSSTTKTIIDSTSYFISDSYTSTTFTAPSSTGSYSLSFTSGVGCNAYYRFATIPDGTDGGCSTPGLTLTGESSSSTVPRYRKQTFMVNAGVSPGDVYNVTVYSHSINVVAVAGDTQSSIVTKLVSAINNTTVAQWDEYGSAAYTRIGTTSYDTYAYNGQTKPYSPRPNSGSIEFSITLNYQNSFGASASPANATGDWKYASYNMNYSVTLPPAISITASSSSINSGGCVDVMWRGDNLHNCTLTKTDLVTSSSVDFTPGDMNPNGTYRDCPLHNTRYTAYCSNVSPSCIPVGNPASYFYSNSDNLFCSEYSSNDESCYLDTQNRCTWH